MLAVLWWPTTQLDEGFLQEYQYYISKERYLWHSFDARNIEFLTQLTVISEVSCFLSFLFTKINKLCYGWMRE
jgi:hypothetical protein